MNTLREVGHGGFFLPEIYTKNQRAVEKNLSEGNIDYADLTQWGFPDELLCFLLEHHFFDWMDRTYPTPRQKTEIPIWFLISCQLVMKLYQTGKYAHLDFLLQSGSILTRFGFNVGAGILGFNQKNQYVRQTMVHADSVRKFFKDTPVEDIREWYQQDCQSWFRQQKAYHHQGIFVLDQSHLVVPDNEHYLGAVKMPVDEHGQLYHHLGKMTAEQKKALIYHRCYTFSTLLNVNLSGDHFHVASYELGTGNEDELVQAKKLLPDFCQRFPGAIQLLIVDRGYIDATLIEQLKNKYHVDVLIPLRSNMSDHEDAVALAKFKNEWEVVEEVKNQQGRCILKKEIASVHDLSLWSELNIKMHACVSRYTYWDSEKQIEDIRYAVLVSTKKYAQLSMMVKYYDCRVQTEERFRQFKKAWYITEFPSPHAGLVESHIAFTLLTYSLIQLYLRRKDLQDQTGRFIGSLKRDEGMGINAVIVYANHHYGVLDLNDYTYRVMELEGSPRQRLMNLMKAIKEDKLKRKS